MSIPKKVLTKISLILLIFSFLSLFSFTALAACTDNTPSCGGPSGNTATSSQTAPGGSSACKDTTTSTALKKCVTQSPLVQDIQKIINFLAAGIGIVVIGVIILGGIQYSIAGDSPQATGAAKQRIVNGLIALLAFIFTFAFLNWLLPGGAFG